MLGWIIEIAPQISFDLVFGLNVPNNAGLSRKVFLAHRICSVILIFPFQNLVKTVSRGGYHQPIDRCFCTELITHNFLLSPSLCMSQPEGSKRKLFPIKVVLIFYVCMVRFTVTAQDRQRGYHKKYFFNIPLGVLFVSFIWIMHCSLLSFFLHISSSVETVIDS